MKDINKMTKEELKEAVEELRKKENDKKEKGENKMEEMLKEVLKKLKGEPSDEYKEQEGKIREGFENLFKDSTCIIVATNKGAMQVGDKPSVMTCICESIQTLLDNGCLCMRDVDYMFKAIKVHNKGQKNEDEEVNIDEMLEKISEIIGD